MEHGLELIIPILEILEIEVCNIIYKPRDIGNLIFSTSSYPGNIGNLSFSTSSYPGNIGSYDPYSVLSWKYWKLKSSTFSISLEILEIWVFQFPHILEILEIRFFYFLMHILKIFEIEVCNILHKPRDIGNLSFSTSSYPGNIVSYDPYINPGLEIVDRTIHNQSWLQSH